MGYWDYYWGLYRGYYKDPFPHSLLSTRQYREPSGIVVVIIYGSMLQVGCWATAKVNPEERIARAPQTLNP